MKVKMKITKSFKDPLTRQANEAVRISNRNKLELLNSKNEFNHPPIRRVTLEKKKKNFEYNKNSSKNIFSENLPATQSRDDSFLSGMELVFNQTSDDKFLQKQSSSDQENYLESTMLFL